MTPWFETLTHTTIIRWTYIPPFLHLRFCSHPKKSVSSCSTWLRTKFGSPEAPCVGALAQQPMTGMNFVVSPRWWLEVLTSCWSTPQPLNDWSVWIKGFSNWIYIYIYVYLWQFYAIICLCFSVFLEAENYKVSKLLIHLELQQNFLTKTCRKCSGLSRV